MKSNARRLADLENVVNPPAKKRQLIVYWNSDDGFYCIPPGPIDYRKSFDGANGTHITEEQLAEYEKSYDVMLVKFVDDWQPQRGANDNQTQTA